MIKTAGVTLGFGMALTVGMAGAADATPVTVSCSSSGHTMNGGATYTTSGSYHIWGPATYTLGGSGTGGQSNENIRLYAGGATKWSYDSPDNRVNGTNYSVSMGSVETLASSKEYMTFQAIFDTLGSDPSCTATSSTV